MRTKLLTGMKSYWPVLVVGAVIIVMVLYMSSQSKELEKLKSDVEITKTLIRDANKTYDTIKGEFDVAKHQETLKERTVSAKKIGQEMIAVDNALTAFYKTNEPLPQDEAKKQAMFDALDKAKAENTRLTGAKEKDHINTWKLNPAWTTTLDTVVTYQDTDRVPVVFSMKTADGKVAGLVVATYDVSKHQLKDITRYYTTDGLKDEIDVGGI